MAKPVIMVIDDEPHVLNAVSRDLQSKYGSDYRIVRAKSGIEGMELVTELKKRNTPIALFLSDQRMPEMTGVEFLNESRKFYPEAREVLLTAYADTQAAVDSINILGLDYYLMKPWDPPEVKLYPVLDDLLGDWVSSVILPYDGIRVAGTLWSASCYETKDFLSRNRVPYQWLDIEKDLQARELVDSVSEGTFKLPVVFFPDGETMFNPSDLDLARKIGLHTEAMEPYYDLVIVGGGPAGLSAAVYGASEGLKTLVIEREATGGQAGTSARIENYLGFPQGLSGADLATRAVLQAQRLGAEILIPHEVVGLREEVPYHIVQLDDGTELNCKALIIATGVALRKLDAPGIADLTGAGIYYGATLSEAANYQGEDVYTVGGANSAGQAAVFFSRYARQVNMVVRGDSLRKSMSQYLIDQINETPNINLITHTEINQAHGTDRLEGLTLQNNQTGESRDVPASALFIFVGGIPRTEGFAGVVERDEHGFILTGRDLVQDGSRPKNWRLQRDPYMLETSVPGIFAVGDVRHGVVRRVVNAVGQGALAVNFVHQYLREV